MARSLNNRLNIRGRLFFLCLAVATPLLSLGVFILWKEYQTLKSEAGRATTFQAATSVRTLSRWLASQQQQLAALASLPAFKQESLAACHSIIVTAGHAKPDWDALFLVNGEGTLLLSNFPQTPATGTSPELNALCQRMRQTGTSIVSDYLICPLTNRPAILVGAPVPTTAAPRYLIACLRPQAVLHLFAGLGENDGSVIVVVDSHNRVVARTLANDRWAGKDYSQARVVQAAAGRWQGILEAVGIADPTRRAYAFDRVPENRWLVIVGVPTAAIYGPAHDRLILTVALAACAMGVSMLVAYQFTRHFTGPINELVREAVAVGRGDLSKRVKLESGDEFGMLARAFNQMAANLQLNEEHKLMVEKISESIRQSLDLDQILNTTVSELGQALAASRCCIALINARSHTDLACELLSFDYLWWDAGRLGAPLKNRTISMSGESMLKTILEQGAILSMDVLDESSFMPLFEDASSYPDDWKSIKSLLACPISTHERPLGLILVHQCDDRRTWSDAELELTDSVATHVALAMEQAYLYKRTKSLADQQLLINHIVRATRASLNLDTILNTVTRELGEALSSCRCQIAQPRQENPLVVTHEFHAPALKEAVGLCLYNNHLDFDPGAGPESHPQTVLGIDLTRLGETSDSKENTTAKDAPLAVIQDVESDSRTIPFRHFLKAIGSQSLIAAPLLNEDRLLGVLMVHQVAAPRTWKPEEIGLVAAIADQVSIAISHAQLFAQVRHQAITDGLTGLYNHVYLKNRLETELRRTHRKGMPLSLLMIDLDKLKQINDTFGHPVGDAAIRQVSWALKNLLRSGDTAARYGGEEFAVILPETPLAEAALIADRLCRQVNATAVPGLGQISVSIGAATFPEQAGGLKELIEMADIALYTAKRSGRNQVRVFDGQSPLGVSAGLGERQAERSLPDLDSQGMK